MTACAIDGCTRPRKYKNGWCNTHYERERRGYQARSARNAELCSIDGCSFVVLARGWCQNHYAQWSRYGDPMGSTRVLPSLSERFWSRVDRHGPAALSWDGRILPGSCWLWTGAPAATGYGVIRAGGRDTYAHRIAHELLVGPIPQGLTIDHLCMVRLCVNPEHLEPVTRAENTRRELACRHQEKEQNIG